jgi:DNA-binding LytR/AlgR family response regulator
VSAGSGTTPREETRLRALIVDDEYPAREELRYLLRRFPEVEVVGEAAEATEALELIRNIDYDLCFLDVRMPGETGLDLAREMARLPHRPAVIFVTAFPDHAVEAFDLDAADYLLKPFDEARLARALQRIIERSPEADDSTSQPRVSGDESTLDKIPVAHPDRTILIDVDDIVYATAARGYSYIVTGEGRHLVSFSLAELERRLKSRGFFRTHRAYLINLRRARALEPDFSGALRLTMDEGTERVPVSRRQARALKKLLGL